MRVWIMVVWGGDTKVDVTDEQDEGVYILDLRKFIYWQAGCTMLMKE